MPAADRHNIGFQELSTLYYYIVIALMYFIHSEIKYSYSYTMLVANQYMREKKCFADMCWNDSPHSTHNSTRFIGVAIRYDLIRLLLNMVLYYSLLPTMLHVQCWNWKIVLNENTDVDTLLIWEQVDAMNCFVIFYTNYCISSLTWYIAFRLSN